MFFVDGADAPVDRSWRRLPRLLFNSFRIVREAAPREFAISSVLQLVQGAAGGIQLLVVCNLLAAVLSGTPHDDYLPALEQLAVLVVLQTLGGLVSVYTSLQQAMMTELVHPHACR